MSNNTSFDSTTLNIQNEELPFVSVCTPTFNRRPFIPFIKKCFEHQTYPKEKMEWIVIDDGFDPVGDLFNDIPQVKYFYFNEHMNLGKKRNLMHSKCSGDIIVYMDDDDYYPPERVSHAVEMLMLNKNALVAGSSEMHIYFDSIKSIMQFGPYGPSHATAATFAFKKELLLSSSYDDNALLAEERHFLKNYTVPFIQLNTLKTILVFSHKHNSLNKDKMLENPHVTLAKQSPYNIFHFMNNSELIKFYMNDVNKLLEHYDPGNPKYKPQILEEIKKVEEKQKINVLVSKKMSEFANKYKTNTIGIDVLIVDYEKIIEDKNFIISELIKKNKMYIDEIKLLKSQQSSVTQPLVTQPLVTQPLVTQPSITQPSVTQPSVTQPSVTQLKQEQPKNNKNNKKNKKNKK
jgi:glycosyltransferase involved in cell wall biosynthesis